jgi:phenylacetate-coenzyme A ligase PaaK-like adenylate-forming protein
MPATKKVLKNKSSIFFIRSNLSNLLQPENFDQIALEVFRFQAQFNPTYKDYLSYLKVAPSAVKEVENIPFLPIEVFKKHRVLTGEWKEEAIFTSSGTTGQEVSKHYVHSLAWYQEIFQRCLKEHIQEHEELTILALLPSYLERSGSSLIYMAQRLIEQSKSPISGFFLNEHEQLIEALTICKNDNKPCLLLGVTFGLLDFADKYSIDFPELKVMETGGMKGRREEWTRGAVHRVLMKAFGVKAIWSEYGMTEMMSQAYAPEGGIFYPAPTVRVLLREVADPLLLSRA